MGGVAVMTEAELQTAVLQLCEKHNILAHHCGAAYHCIGSGFPDLVLAGPYGVMFIELKLSPGTRTPAQLTWGYTLTAGGARYAVYTPQELHSGVIESSLVQIAYPPAQAA